jgi:hypothetical protein
MFIVCIVTLFMKHTTLPKNIRQAENACLSQTLKLTMLSKNYFPTGWLFSQFLPFGGGWVIRGHETSVKQPGVNVIRLLVFTAGIYCHFPVIPSFNALKQYCHGKYHGMAVNYYFCIILKHRIMKKALLTSLNRIYYWWYFGWTLLITILN